jgi:hypothetical protein
LPESDTWGKGYGTEALHLWIDFLFRQMPLQTIYLKSWTGNHRMRRVAHKCGFWEVSRSPHRAQIAIRGEPLVLVEYMVSRSEWVARSLSDSAANSGRWRNPEFRQVVANLNESPHPAWRATNQVTMLGGRIGANREIDIPLC